jgi:hypothetical protein
MPEPDRTYFNSEQRQIRAECRHVIVTHAVEM